MAITVMQFLKITILGRVLGPEVFGVIAITLILIELGGVFIKTGLSQAIIQKSNPTKNELSSLYWLNVFLGIIIFILFYLASPLVAHLFDMPILRKVIPVISLAFLYTPFGIQIQTLSEKQLEFKTITYIDIISVFITVFIAIISAIKFELGIWSLVLGHLGGQFVRTFMLVYYGFKIGVRPGFYFNLNEIKPYLSFGFFRVLAMTANYFNSKIDQVVIGSILGTTTLGYYSMASNIVKQPVAKLTPIITRVGFPAFSQVKDNIEKLKKGYLDSISFVMLIISPILFGIIVVADEAVIVLLGEEWLKTIPLIKILALNALFRSIGGASSSIILAKGHADWSFYWNIGLLFIYPPIIIIVSKIGDIFTIAWSLVLLQCLLFFINYFLRLRKILGRFLYLKLKIILQPIIISAVMACTVFLFSYLIPEKFNINALLALKIIIGFITYFLLVMILKFEQIKTLLIR